MGGVEHESRGMGSMETETMHSAEITAQLAVYTRKTNRERYCFSHIREDRITKLFPGFFNVKELSKCQRIKDLNESTYKNAPILILVTGDNAEMISYASSNNKRRHFFKYDVSEFYSKKVRRGLDATFSDLTRGYMAMSVLSTIACYEKGEFNDWHITNVIPVLSDWIIIPRILKLKHIDVIVRSYGRSAKKCLRDSMYLAEGYRFRESSLEEINSKNLQYSPEVCKNS